METKIIRNDRGLDFRRIEQFIKLFQEKCRKKSDEIRRQQSVVENERKEKAFEHFGLTAEVDVIKTIDEQIKELKKQREIHEEKIRDFTQGTDKNKRYNTYDNIREGSPIQQYIDEGSEQLNVKKSEIWQLNESLANELWFARDLEQAIEIMNRFYEKLENC